jgi:hypothetical protein
MNLRILNGLKRQREEILAERDRIKREKTKEECEMC